MTNRKLLAVAFVATLVAAAAVRASAASCQITLRCPTNFLKVGGINAGAYPLQVSAGGTSVWALDTNFTPYRWDPSTRLFSPTAGAPQLSQISVGGGSMNEPDAVWGVGPQPAGAIYRWIQGTWSAVPGSLAQIVVGKGFSICYPYEVWGLNSASQIYHYDFCNDTWEFIPGSLVTLSIGGGEIWGLNSVHQIFRYTGSGWQQIPGSLVNIAVGADGVWGVNGSQQVFQFNPSTQLFVQIPYAVLTIIAAGGNGVWGINPSNQVYRYRATTRAFVQSPNVSLYTFGFSVGSGGGVWGIDTAYHIRAFVTPAVTSVPTK